ncbi:MAG: radical SAM protein [Nitrospirota bacterium]|jgi:uncharacterized Fe-S cluster-containing radical SAM superfamily protein
MYNAIELAESTSKIVCRDSLRKYYRFRPARFYGGISTADCVGCCLRCVFCWSWNVVSRPTETGKFHSPEDVARRLVAIAKKKFEQLRISGNEPTMCREHLVEVLELIPRDYLFILETNGILIGSDETYAEELSKFPRLYVRVSLKGTCEEEFSRLTGAVPEGFGLQTKALEHLVKHKVKTHPACMTSFSTQENVASLKKRLKAIHPAFAGFEVEELILYPAVKERLKKHGIEYFSGYSPDDAPAEQI